MWRRFYKRYGDLSQEENFERCLEAMLAYKNIKVLEPDPERIRREFWAGSPTYERLFALFHMHFAEKMGKPRWGDQLGLVEVYADVIFAAYPTAKMIHMIRDPRDRYLVSQPKRSARAGRVGWEIAGWLDSAKLAQQNKDQYPDRYMVVRYETLMERPEHTLRQVCSFLGEPFLPSMLTMEDALRFDDQLEPQSRRPAEVALAAMSNPGRELAFTQAYARQQIVECGYSLWPLQLSFRDRLLFNLVDRPINLASMLTWRTWQAIRT